METRREVTRLLSAWSAGNEEALEQLMPLVYDELRRLARGYLAKERRELTLQATGLVNEAYLRLIDQSGVEWTDRSHFFAIAARTMRRILVDHARARRADKRGGEIERLVFDEQLDAFEESGIDVDLLDLDEALKELAAFDERQAKLVELRFFGGLSIRETGEMLGLSPATVKREWALARAWLYRRLGGKG